MAQPNSSEVTPHSVYLNRRNFLRTSIFAGTGLLTTGLYRSFRPARSGGSSGVGVDAPTSFEDITHYNNFYEFSTDKEDVAARAERWQVPPWSLKIDGLVENPLTLDLDKIMAMAFEDRVYRHRCVEGWSMVIPWRGFSLNQLLEKVRPTAEAKYVEFTSYYDQAAMPDAAAAGLNFPYREGLRLDEALHPLALVATGLYQKPLPNQNGAALRMVLPWKYGFKSIKSIVRIELVKDQPPTTWNLANASEYGFYSNVNPAVDHPRWSQAHERRIGETKLRETLPFNGYESEVQNLYRDMDLRKYF